MTIAVADAVVPPLKGVPKALLEQVERLAEQRHLVVRLDDPEQVRVRARVDRQPSLDVYAPARPGTRGCVRGVIAACGHGRVRRGGEREVELGEGVELKEDVGGLLQDCHPELERGFHVRGELCLRSHVRARGKLDACG